MAYPSAMTPDQIADLVKDTQELIIKKGAYTNLMTDLTEFVGVNKLYKSHRKTFAGGIDWRFNLVMGHNNSARFVSLFENDTANRPDNAVVGKVSPRFVEASYVFDVREPVLNSGDSVQIVDFVKQKNAEMYMSFYELLEEAIWGTPTSSTDTKTPYGVAYWVQKMANADASTYTKGGFRGLDPAIGARAGVSSATYSRWANWAAQYTDISKDDLVAKMRYATRKINFKSPIALNEPTLGTGRAIFCGVDTITKMEEILEAQNMNLGNDMASKDGKTLFKGTPVEYVPALDADTTAPIYMLDFSTLALGMTAGWAEHVSAPQVVPNQHNTRQVFLDAGVNMACTNLRNQAVIHKALA